MSNALLKLCNQLEGLPAVARQVLHVLADEARGYDNDCSSLKTAEIAKRTGLSRRTIHRAYVVLAEAGHITRLEIEPGAALKTRVHPQLGGRAPDAELAEGYDRVSYPSDTQSHPQEYIDKTINHSPSASAREPLIEGFRGPAPDTIPAAPEPPPMPPQPAERELDPVAQIIAAWNAMAASHGLPGPISADVPREAAIEALLRREKLWRVLAAVDAVGRSAWLTGKRQGGQGDWMATFDWIFEVRRFAGSGNFNRVLEGEFNRGQGVPVEPPSAAPAVNEYLTVGAGEARDETEDIRRLRARLRAEEGDHLSAAWIDPLRFEWRGGDLLAIAPSAFHAEWITGHFLGALRGAAGGAAVQVRVRQRA